MTAFGQLDMQQLLQENTRMEYGEYALGCWRHARHGNTRVTHHKSLHCLDWIEDIILVTCVPTQ